MDEKAIDAARLQLERARKSMTALKASKDFSEVENHWADFLVAAGRAFTKLEQGSKKSGKSQAWWGRILHKRRNEPLLCYLWHARNVDEHTLQQVTQRHPGGTSAIAPTEHDLKMLRRAVGIENTPHTVIGVYKFSLPQVMLVDVVDKGVRYSAPAGNPGSELTKMTPTQAGDIAIVFIEIMLKEATELIA